MFAPAVQVMLCLRHSDVLRSCRKVICCVPLFMREAHITQRSRTSHPKDPSRSASAEHIVEKSTLSRAFFWQGQKDSNPQERFWRPLCYHYIMPLFLLQAVSYHSRRQIASTFFFVSRSRLQSVLFTCILYLNHVFGGVLCALYNRSLQYSEISEKVKRSYTVFCPSKSYRLIAFSIFWNA